MKNKIALVTPLKDEVEHISRLISSIENQTVKIYAWVIIENGSVDGSRERLAQISEVRNVEHFQVINYTFDDNAYRLGKKYATIVAEGISYLKKRNIYDGLNYLGILDADVFPEPAYYQTILAEFMKDENAGIIGGYGKTDEGEIHFDNKNDPCGNAMVFLKNCLDTATYRITPSAASVIKTKARILGYKVKTTFDTWFTCRKMGLKVDQQYYGESAYYMGIPLYHAVFYFMKHFTKGYFNHSTGYIRGYIASMIQRKERIDDVDIIKFNRYRIINKIKNSLR